MFRKKLIWKLYPSYLVLALVCVIAMTWYAIYSADYFFQNHLKEDLQARGWLLVPQIRDKIEAGHYQEIQKICKECGKNGARITVILPDGKVIGDSEEDPANMENHAHRPEIKKAFTGIPGNSIRPSPTLQINMVYAAVPVRLNEKIIGVVRISIPLANLYQDTSMISNQIVFGGFIAAGLAVIVCLLIAHYIAKPLKELKAGAERFAKGDLDFRFPLSDCEEINALIKAMNSMAAELSDKLKQVNGQKKELDAILSSMIEGIIAVDVKERVISINDAAARIFQLDCEKVQGRFIQEVFRNQALQDIIKQAMNQSDSVEGDIVLFRPKERFLQAHATMLDDEDKKRIGVVVVLNDVTRLRKLENIRRDFVANVSHELKTPITSIMGFVDTLQDWANIIPEDRDRFLAIVLKQTNRLNAIIEDLLLLSRLEQGDDQLKAKVVGTQLKIILSNAIEVCKPKADNKNIEIKLTCPEEVNAVVNGPLLEQAVVNLIDNAVKYSDKDKPVEVIGCIKDKSIIIKVRDYGCGIEEQHIPRLFERFYRVDKARSRQLGGTGLGLAIVKHIAQIFEGRIKVESHFGSGSTFSIYIPNQVDQAS